MKIRPIQPDDNKAVAQLIRDVLIEHNVPKVGTAYADASLDCMYETYSVNGAAYFVVEDEGRLIGGAGIAALENGPEGICELQKMYFLPETRGRGIGARMMDTCLEAAVDLGYSQCYLETMPYMEAAQRLYKRSGFTYLNAPLGNTGHTSCPVWMIKSLTV